MCKAHCVVYLDGYKRQNVVGIAVLCASCLNCTHEKAHFCGEVNFVEKWREKQNSLQNDVDLNAIPTRYK